MKIQFPGGMMKQGNISSIRKSEIPKEHCVSITVHCKVRMIGGRLYSRMSISTVRMNSDSQNESVAEFRALLRSYKPVGADSCVLLNYPPFNGFYCDRCGWDEVSPEKNTITRYRSDHKMQVFWFHR